MSKLQNWSLRAARWVNSVVANQRGHVPAPSWCTFLVCNRCNARCGMCDSWRLPRGRELSPPEVQTLFRKLRPLDVVRLSGGEPFLRGDLLAVAEAVLRGADPAVVHITTNGSFPDRVERLAASFSAPERLRLMVSLDGLEAEHDRNRGRVVTFAKAEETVRRLVALRNRGLDVSVNHTIVSARSLRDAPELARRMQRLGVEVQSVLAYEDSAMYGRDRRGQRSEDLVIRDGYPLHPALPQGPAEQFVERELERVAGYRSAALRLAKRYYLRGLLARLRGVPKPRPRPRCVALRSHLRLLPDGSVPVCQFNTETVGNLADEPLEKVWHGPASDRARAWVDACEGCWAECEVMPNALYTGDLWRSLVPASRLRH